MKALVTLLTIVITSTAFAAVQEQAHYNLKGAGGIRDTACPPTLKDQAGKSPDLVRQGSPKVMSNGPEVAPAGIRFVHQVRGAGPVLSASPRTSSTATTSSSRHGRMRSRATTAAGMRWWPTATAAAASSSARTATSGRCWSAASAGPASAKWSRKRGRIWPSSNRAAQTTGWLNGKKVCESAGPGRRRAELQPSARPRLARNRSSGWIAEVRYSTFKPGQVRSGGGFPDGHRRSSRASRRRNMAERGQAGGVAVENARA